MVNKGPTLGTNKRIYKKKRKRKMGKKGPILTIYFGIYTGPKQRQSKMVKIGPDLDLYSQKTFQKKRKGKW